LGIEIYHTLDDWRKKQEYIDALKKYNQENTIEDDEDTDRDDEYGEESGV
jgi:hypothetical protein